MMEALKTPRVDNGPVQLTPFKTSRPHPIGGCVDNRDTASVLDAPAIDFGAILSDQVRRMHLPLPSPLASGALLLSGLTMPVRLGDAVTIDEFARFKGPLFLSHGSADRVVPIQVSDELVSRRIGITDYLRTRADHIQSWKADPSGYEASLRVFLASLPNSQPSE